MTKYSMYCLPIARTPRTTTTISWITGEVGIGFVTVPDGYLSSAEMADINEQYKGVLHIESSGTDSHMWNGATTCKFLEIMTIELRRQRAKIGCHDASARALVVCDRCSSHVSKVYVEQRRLWAKEQNVLLIGCDHEDSVQVPGGWGLSSSPNDAWHGHYHLLRSTYMRTALKMPTNPLHRRAMEECEVAPGGALPQITCSTAVSFAADVWALSSIKPKIIWWSWMSRGYLSKEQCAEWFFDGDVENMEEHMGKVRDSYQSLMRLKETPVLDKSDLAAKRIKGKYSMYLSQQDMKYIKI